MPGQTAHLIFWWFWKIDEVWGTSFREVRVRPGWNFGEIRWTIIALQPPQLLALIRRKFHKRESASRLSVKSVRTLV